MNSSTLIRRGTLAPVRDFHLGHTLESAQSFRWEPHGEGYLGPIRDEVYYLEQRGDTLCWESTAPGNSGDFLKRYLDLERDLPMMRETLDRDDYMHMALERFWGMRILRQDVWECLGSFILSQNNNVPRIRGMIARIAARFGRAIEFRGQSHHGFPSPAELAGATVDELEACGTGYRAPYLLQAARDVAAGRLDLAELEPQPYPAARETLMRLQGIGEKVADCVCLFSLGHLEALPVDVWVRRIVERLYLGRRAALREIQAFGNNYFGPYVGYAQQYLFHYARTVGYDALKNKSSSIS